MSSDAKVAGADRRSTLSTRRMSRGRTRLIVVARMVAAFALVWSGAAAS